MVDPAAFRSDKLPTEHFDARFSDANLRYWVPLLVRAGEIGPSTRVLDVGCGTGGFAREIAASVGADVTGCDVSSRFIDHARSTSKPGWGSVEWIVGDAEQLPVASGAFDCVILSLVLHQVSQPDAVLREVRRALRDGGRVVIRTIAPEDAAERIPARFFPSMAAADTARMPPIDEIEELLAGTGLVVTSTSRSLRNAPLDIDHEKDAARTEIASRYPFVGRRELESGLRSMERAAAAATAWIDPRPTYFIVAVRPAANAGERHLRRGNCGVSGLSQRVIVWDFDGTLARRHGGTSFAACMVETLVAHEPGHAVTVDRVRPFLRSGFPWHSPAISHCELETPDMWWGRVEPLLARAYEGVGYPADRAGELGALARRNYVDTRYWELFEDTIPVLAALSERGWRHLVLSNHVPELDAIIAQLGLAPLLDAVVNSAVTGYEKPHPEAFAIARRAAGEPSEIWMVGDNPKADVEGARAAGIPAILARSEAARELVEHHAATLHEVEAIVTGAWDA